MRDSVLDNLSNFIVESNRIEGIYEINWFEVKAHEKFLKLEKVTVADLEEFVKVVQPGACLRRYPGMNVKVGNHIAPYGGPDIDPRLQAILDLNISPYERHLLYENLHPFTDGNGRSGRVLWLWNMGGLMNAPLGFLHHFYYQTLENQGSRR